MKREHRRIVGEFVILAIYLVLEVYAIWPVSHGWSLFFAALGITALVFAEFPHNLFIYITLVTVAACILVYFAAPPIELSETETHGWLIPSNKPSPTTTTCIPAGKELRIIAGNNVAGFSSSLERALLLKVDDSPIISVQRDGDRLGFDVNIYNKEHKLAVRIVRNEFHLISGHYTWRERGEDRSEIVVHNEDDNDEDMLHISYINK